MRPEEADFEDFFEVAYPKVVRVLGAAWRDHAAAEEAAQEAFARTYVRWARVRRMDRPDGYVFTIAANLLRRRVRADEELADRPELDTPVDDRVAVRVSVAAAVATLPPRQRQAVLLRYVADLPVAEVAAAMGCAPGTVKATLHQALLSLNIDMTEDPDGS